MAMVYVTGTLGDSAASLAILQDKLNVENVSIKNG